MGEDLDAVLEPLRSREQVLDELLAGARRAAEDALAAARGEGARVGAEARRTLDAELAADRETLARELEALALARGRQLEERVARLRAAARERWEDAIAFCVRQTMGAAE